MDLERSAIRPGLARNLCRGVGSVSAVSEDTEVAGTAVSALAGASD